jgi:MoaA/NifB/PqqE/SkfB family radical SAM enzyme
MGNKYGDPTGWPKGLMGAGTLDRILEKAKRECAVSWVCLFNWTEPLLHPNIAELIGVVKKHDVPLSLSSNLNVIRNPDEILASNPNFFRISLSGFTQPIYERGHREGDVETVKNNMVKLADAKIRTGSSTLVEVLYHKYNYNLHEIDPMRKNFPNRSGFI